MKIYRSLDDVPHNNRTVLTIGTFDGVHRGHRAIIDAMTRKAAEIDGRTVVLTFHPHPQEVLRKNGSSVPILSTITERAQELEKLGVDVLLVLEFTTDVAATSWQEFCDAILSKIGLAHIIVGHDHAFGKGREGTVSALTAYGKDHGFGVTEISPLRLDEESISSTKIRRALLSGDLALANNYLGRRYSIEGEVIRGDGRGRTIGIPTANIQPLEPAKLIPANGVYCVSMRIGDITHFGMANIGVRPTFTDGTVRTIEVHLFDFDKDIYGHTVTVGFLKFVRSEQKFGSKEEFLAQLERDRRDCLETIEKDREESGSTS